MCLSVTQFVMRAAAAELVAVAVVVTELAELVAVRQQFLLESVDQE